MALVCTLGEIRVDHRGRDDELEGCQWPFTVTAREAATGSHRRLSGGSLGRCWDRHGHHDGRLQLQCRGGGRLVTEAATSLAASYDSTRACVPQPVVHSVQLEKQKKDTAKVPHRDWRCCGLVLVLKSPAESKAKPITRAGPLRNADAVLLRA